MGKGLFGVFDFFWGGTHLIVLKELNVLWNVWNKHKQSQWIKFFEVGEWFFNGKISNKKSDGPNYMQLCLKLKRNNQLLWRVNNNIIIIRAVYHCTDPIWYVSSILLIDIRYISTIFSILSSNRSIQPTEICDVEKSFPCVNFVVLNSTFSASKPITNLNCVFISYTLQRLCYESANYNKTLFYWTNANENGFLNVFSTRNLYNSLTSWISLAPVQKRGSTVLHINTEVFNAVHHKIHRFLAFFWCFLSEMYRNKYRMNKDDYAGSDIKST